MNGLFHWESGETYMYKEYMLKCEFFNPLDGIWENQNLFFDTENEMREYIESKGKNIRVEAMFKLMKIEW